MKKLSKLEAILWNIALPGFSQMLTGRFVIGILLIFLEFLINVNSHFNLAIMYSFMGQIGEAAEVIDFQWLMFYPCVYMFGMWDAYREAMPEGEQFSYLPFVFSAYFVTVGLMYSTKMSLFGVKPGPVFLPMLFVIPGVFTGILLKFFILSYKKKS